MLVVICKQPFDIPELSNCSAFEMGRSLESANLVFRKIAKYRFARFFRQVIESTKTKASKLFFRRLGTESERVFKGSE